MAFEPIETQEQLDSIIKDRVARAKESALKEAAEKYADYDELKAKAESLTTQVTDLTNALDKATSTSGESEKTIAELTAKVAKYETDSVKTRVAHELGLDYNAIQFIQGEDEEAIKDSANSLLSLVGKQTAPLASTEPANVEQSKDSSYKKMLGELFDE